jgi:hypothetical protein
MPSDHKLKSFFAETAQVHHYQRFFLARELRQITYLQEFGLSLPILYPNNRMPLSLLQLHNHYLLQFIKHMIKTAHVTVNT